LRSGPIRSIAERCLERGEEGGLNSDVKFAYVLVDTTMVDKDILAKMQKLQPTAKVSTHLGLADSSLCTSCEASTWRTQ
jgi:hypothetical protein